MHEITIAATFIIDVLVTVIEVILMEKFEEFARYLGYKIW